MLGEIDITDYPEFESFKRDGIRVYVSEPATGVIQLTLFYENKEERMILPPDSPWVDKGKIIWESLIPKLEAIE